jgi:hypothetical protein
MKRNETWGKFAWATIRRRRKKGVNGPEGKKGMEQVGMPKIHTCTTPSSISRRDYDIAEDEENAADENGRGALDDEDDDGNGGGLEHDDLEVLELHHLHQEQDGDSDPTARYLRADDDEVDVRALAHVYANADDDEGEGYTVEQLSREEDTSSSQESNLDDLARSGPIPINVRDQFDDSVDDDDGLQLCNTSYEAEVEEDEDKDKNVSAFISPDASETGHGQDETAAEDEGGSPGETTRSIMARLAIKLGKQPDDVLPFTLQLEKEWLLTRQQLRTTLASDDDAVFHRLQFPLGLVFALKEELGITEGDVPNMLKYKVLKKQIEQKQLRAGNGNGGAGSDAVDKDGSPGGGRPGGSVAGRKRKRLTVADWREKVERFALDTQHAPSPFRATSIFQVECFCCGYAVNMNKPGIAHARTHARTKHTHGAHD